MNDSRDLPPDLLRLRTLETWLILTLDRVQRQIADAERQEQERQRAAAARPPAPAWLLELGLNRDAPPVYIHEGHCHMAGKRSHGITRVEALRWLASGVAACSHCRADTELGFLDG
ncbi:DUF6233 domain-containing protein [Streptomyces sp. NPDC001027]|uniref:DUF6233 domain-containing protein n=1 Tax=Streptomyces sp. NPDC001027 TaxID=3154771 RepID=UPI003318662C